MPRRSDRLRLLDRPRPSDRKPHKLPKVKLPKVSVVIKIEKPRPKKNSPGFLDLPRELRDMIYRPLLSPRLGNQTRKSYSLTHGLLRVNKQMHAEAYEILYGEHCWVHFRIDFYPRMHIEEKLLDTKAPTIALRCDYKRSFGGTPSMKIEMYERNRPKSSDKSSLIASAYDLPRLMCSLRKTSSQRVRSIGLQLAESMSRYPHHLDRLVAALREFMTLDYSIDFSGLCQGFEGLLARTSGVNEAGEQLDKIDWYQARGDREHAMGNLEAAAMIFRDGYYFTGWGKSLGGTSLSWSTDNEVFAKHRRRAGLVTASAICDSELGLLKNAQIKLEEVLEKGWLPAVDTANNFYHLGLCLIARSKPNEGAYNLILAAGLQPKGAIADCVDRSLTALVGNIKSKMDSLPPVRLGSEDSPELIFRNIDHARKRLGRIGWVIDNFGFWWPTDLGWLLSPDRKRAVIGSLEIEWILSEGEVDARYIKGDLRVIVKDGS